MTHTHTPRASLPLDEDRPPPDGGEPQGSRDPDRPAMLGKRFRQTIAGGMLVGLALALIGHAVLVAAWYDGATLWSWLFVGLGGLAVGGAISLFVYGTATDRTDTGSHPRGRAAVSEEGEEHRALRRRR
jgi:hypothetical protein